MVTIQRGGGTTFKQRSALLHVSQSENLSKMSTEMFATLADVFNTWIGASEASLLSGYAANIVVTDFLHSAGLITDRAYEAVFVLETIMSGVAIGTSFLTGLFGANSPLSPKLQTRVLTKGQFSDVGDKGGVDMAKNASTLASLVPAVAAAVI